METYRDGWISYIYNIDIYETRLHVLGFGFFSYLISIFMQTFLVEVYVTYNMTLVSCVQCNELIFIDTAK